MKVTRVDTRIVRLPADEPLANGPAIPGATRDFVTVEVRTDEGIEGIGITYFGGALIGALKSAVDALGALAVGEDPLRIEAVTEKFRAAAGSAGPAGIYLLAASAIDIALWDIKGKALGQSVSKLAGGFRERVVCYASTALRREFALDHCAKAASHLVDQGFRQMKMQLALPGKPSIAREVERVRVIRESVGEDVDILVDVNQHWDAGRAIAIGRALEPYHLYWLEDVISNEDYPGLARVAAALDTPITAGEFLYGKNAFRHLLEAHAADIVMIDLLRVGGITQWLRIAGMAEAFNVPVAGHRLPEIDLHLIAAVPNGLTVEYTPWTRTLFEEVPVLDNGELVVPDKPGLGLAFDRKTIERYG
jgi:L-alanine-DL-glutamate epimerase-like enolase superfamily enzyme